MPHIGLFQRADVWHCNRMILEADLLDARQQRSRRALHEALERLIETNDLSEITISALAREAGVGRPVFYRLYGSVSELLADRMSVDLDRQFGAAEQHWRIHGAGLGVMRIATLFALDAIAARPKLYTTLLDGSGGTNAVTMFRAQVARLMTLLPGPPEGGLNVPDHLRISLIASAISGFLLAWIEQGLKPPSDEAAPIMEVLLKSAW